MVLRAVSELNLCLLRPVFIWLVDVACKTCLTLALAMLVLSITTVGLTSEVALRACSDDKRDRLESLKAFQCQLYDYLGETVGDFGNWISAGKTTTLFSDKQVKAA